MIMCGDGDAMRRPSKNLPGPRVYFLGDKKTINPKIAFLGWGRFFILPPKNRSNQLILPHQLSEI
jgi:hypothetical protein